MFDARSWIESQKYGSEIEVQMKYFCLGLVTYKQGLMEIMIETFGTVISQNRID